MMKMMLGLGGSARACGAMESAARSAELSIEIDRNIACFLQTNLARCAQGRADSNGINHYVN